MDNRPQNAIEDELERIKSLKRKAARMIEAERRRLMAMEQKQQEIKRRLASIGNFLTGYVWRQEGSGSRCGGGSHVVSFGDLGLSSENVDELFQKVENTEIDLSSDTSSSGTLIEFGMRRRVCFSFRDFFRHSVCASSWRLNSLSLLLPKK